MLLDRVKVTLIRSTKTKYKHANTHKDYHNGRGKIRKKDKRTELNNSNSSQSHQNFKNIWQTNYSETLSISVLFAFGPKHKKNEV